MTILAKCAVDKWNAKSPQAAKNEKVTLMETALIIFACFDVAALIFTVVKVACK
jgi:hypothetical protein